MEKTATTIAKTVKGASRAVALAALLALALLAAGCGDDDSGTGETGKLPPATDTTPILIAAGNESKNEVKEDSVYLISGEGTLRQMYQRVTGVSDMNWSTTDFKTRVMYGVQLKPTKAGESVDVYKIEQGDGEVIVHAYRTLAGEKCKLANKTTRPWAVYETGPKRGKPRLELTDATGSSCDGR